MESPLIITLQLDETSQSFFDNQRRRYFPAHVNYLDAHLTLFHSLPAKESSLSLILEKFSNRDLMKLSVNSIKFTGNGVAYMIVSDELQDLHATLQQAFDPWLIRKDRQLLQPHITIQNKVTSFKAQTLYKQLQSVFQPFEAQAIGIKTWLYLKGPWLALEHFSFHKK